MNTIEFQKVNKDSLCCLIYKHPMKNLLGHLFCTLFEFRTKHSNTFWDFAAFVTPLAIIFLDDRTHYQLYSIICTCTFFYCPYLWSETIWVQPLTTNILGLACTILLAFTFWKKFHSIRKIEITILSWSHVQYIVYTCLFRLGSIHKLCFH